MRPSLLLFVALLVPTMTVGCAASDSDAPSGVQTADQTAVAKAPSQDALNSAIVDAVTQRYATKLAPSAAANLPSSIRCGDSNLSGFPALKLTTDARGSEILLDTTDGDQVSGFFFEKSDLEALAAGRVAVIPVKQYSGYWWSDGSHYAFEDSACRLSAATGRSPKVAPSDALSSAMVDAVGFQYATKLPAAVATKLPAAIHCSGSAKLTGFQSLNLMSDANNNAIVLDMSDGDQIAGFFFDRSDLEALATNKVNVIPAKEYGGYWWSDGSHYAFSSTTCKLQR